MKKTIGIFAHVDAGKTTFSEQLLYHTKSIKTRGRVDHKEAFLDSHNIERERGITVFSDIGIFNYEDSEYYLIDTPGHIDFSPEMERAMGVLDYAILLISAVEGVQGHTETVWQLLRKNNIPTFIFINKTDREGADLQKVIHEIRNNLSSEVCLVEEDLYNLSNENIEFIAERNEELLETYLGKGYDNYLWVDKLKELIKSEKIFIVLKGSALLDEGVKEFLENFNSLSYTNYEEIKDNKCFKGRVFKIKYDEKVIELPL